MKQRNVSAYKERPCPSECDVTEWKTPLSELDSELTRKNVENGIITICGAVEILDAVWHTPKGAHITTSVGEHHDFRRKFMKS